MYNFNIITSKFLQLKVFPCHGKVKTINSKKVVKIVSLNNLHMHVVSCPKHYNVGSPNKTSDVTAKHVWPIFIVQYTIDLQNDPITEPETIKLTKIALRILTTMSLDCAT